MPVALLQPLYIDRTNQRGHPGSRPVRTLGRCIRHEESDWVRPVPVADLVAPKVRSRIGFLDWHGPAFSIDGYLLWGFTGGVVDAVLNLAGWEQPWEEPWQDGQPVDVVDLFAALETSRNGENLVPALLGDEVGGELQQSPDQDSVTASTTTRDTTRSAKEVDG